MKNEPYEYTEADITSMVLFLRHFHKEDASREMATKILRQMTKDVKDAKPEDILAIYALLNQE